MRISSLLETTKLERMKVRERISLQLADMTTEYILRQLERIKAEKNTPYKCNK